MSQITLYTEKKQEYTELAFIKDTQYQVKIREITNSYEFSKAFAIWVHSTAFKVGIKEEVPDLFKEDIKELINMRFKSLSVDELYYAFKLERFGIYGDKTAHYQSFNADYVSAILDKYIEWKRTVKVTHNISAAKTEKQISDEEKRFWINQGVTKALTHWEETAAVSPDHVYLYEYFIAEKQIAPSDQEKKKTYEDAKLILEIELKGIKAKDRDESREIKHFLSNLQSKKNPKVISKSKELLLAKYFRELRKEGKLEAFKLKYKNDDKN